MEGPQGFNGFAELCGGSSSNPSQQASHMQCQDLYGAQAGLPDLSAFGMGGSSGSGDMMCLAKGTRWYLIPSTAASALNVQARNLQLPKEAQHHTITDFVLVDEMFSNVWNMPSMQVTERVVKQGEKYLDDIRIDFYLEGKEYTMCRMCGKVYRVAKYAALHYNKYQANCWDAIREKLEQHYADASAAAAARQGGQGAAAGRSRLAKPPASKKVRTFSAAEELGGYAGQPDSPTEESVAIAVEGALQRAAQEVCMELQQYRTEDPSPPPMPQTEGAPPPSFMVAAVKPNNTAALHLSQGSWVYIRVALNESASAFMRQLFRHSCRFMVDFGDGIVGEATRFTLKEALCNDSEDPDFGNMQRQGFAYLKCRCPAMPARSVSPTVRVPQDNFNFWIAAPVPGVSLHFLHAADFCRHFPLSPGSTHIHSPAPSHHSGASRPATPDVHSPPMLPMHPSAPRGVLERFSSNPAFSAAVAEAAAQTLAASQPQSRRGSATTLHQPGVMVTRRYAGSSADTSRQPSISGSSLLPPSAATHAGATSPAPSYGNPVSPAAPCVGGPSGAMSEEVQRILSHLKLSTQQANAALQQQAINMQQQQSDAEPPLPPGYYSGLVKSEDTQQHPLVSQPPPTPPNLMPPSMFLPIGTDAPPSCGASASSGGAMGPPPSLPPAAAAAAAAGMRMEGQQSQQDNSGGYFTFTPAANGGGVSSGGGVGGGETGKPDISINLGQLDSCRSADFPLPGPGGQGAGYGLPGLQLDTPAGGIGGGMMGGGMGGMGLLTFTPSGGMAGLMGGPGMLMGGGMGMLESPAGGGYGQGMEMDTGTCRRLTAQQLQEYEDRKKNNGGGGGGALRSGMSQEDIGMGVSPSQFLRKL